jgi:hypothetical protein
MTLVAICRSDNPFDEIDRYIYKSFVRKIKINVVKILFDIYWTHQTKHSLDVIFKIHDSDV